jgi:hypothetical protein
MATASAVRGPDDNGRHVLKRITMGDASDAA